MRCSRCGSTNIDIDRQQTSKYSWGKGFLGSLVFGAPGAVAGVGGKTKTTTEYHCMACGNIGDFSWVIMDPDTQSRIDIALEYNDTAKLKSFKQRYRNIEWTPSSSIGGGMSQSQNYSNDPDFLITYDRELRRYNGPNDKQVVIPNGVVSIDEKAFMNCRLESITIPNSVRSIGKKAFWCCIVKSSILIPKSVVSIKEQAFGGSTIGSIVIPENVITIEKHAFDFTYVFSLSFSKPHGWIRIASKDGKSYPIDEAILRDSYQAQKFLKENKSDLFRRNS